MKFDDSIYIHNMSKSRKWKLNSISSSDYYFIYQLKKSELGDYLNTWFKGVHKDVIKGGEKFIIIDELITLKMVDKETACNLYNQYYNPVSINIHCPVGASFKKNDKGEYLYTMKAKIHSIDDSQYGIWFNDTLENLKSIRDSLVSWINSSSILNGEEFLKFCLSVGGNEDTIDYN
jgi:hypothetical protein